MTDPDYNTMTEEEQYFERSGCGCLLFAALAALAIVSSIFLIIILNQ